VLTRFNSRRLYLILSFVNLILPTTTSRHLESIPASTQTTRALFAGEQRT
jgi:hypothetical protein